MHSIKFNDWQEMALKKDTEAILKKLNSHEPIFFSLCWEIAIAIGAVIVDHLFDTEKVDEYVWIICIFLAVLPPLVIVGYKIVRWIIAVKQVQAGKYDIGSFVDTFDNQICYWVMMSHSYSHLLLTGKSIKKSERVFLYQEGSYYNNKSVQALFSMKPVIDKVFSSDSSTVIDNHLVAVYRLWNIVELIQQNQETLDNCVMEINDDSKILEQQRINETIKNRLSLLIADAEKVFSV